LRVTDARFETAAGGMASMPPPTRPEVAFIGRSNVGKSSLINRLVGRKSLARTSRTPGKTREFNFYLVNEKLFFVDLPGFGYARVSKTERARWQRMIGAYLTERPTLRLMIHLIDGRHAPTDLDLEVMALVRECAAPYAIAMTKCDKLSGNQRPIQVRTVRDAALEMGLEVPVILTSAKDGRGRQEVLNLIATMSA
jgi:GTP-binding protein